MILNMFIKLEVEVEVEDRVNILEEFNTTFGY